MNMQSLTKDLCRYWFSESHETYIINTVFIGEFDFKGIAIRYINEDTGYSDIMIMSDKVSQRFYDDFHIKGESRISERILANIYNQGLINTKILNFNLKKSGKTAISRLNDVISDEERLLCLQLMAEGL
jgi:hypothetical protein